MRASHNAPGYAARSPARRWYNRRARPVAAAATGRWGSPANPRRRFRLCPSRSSPFRPDLAIPPDVSCPTKLSIDRNISLPLYRTPRRRMDRRANFEHDAGWGGTVMKVSGQRIGGLLAASALVALASPALVQ